MEQADNAQLLESSDLVSLLRPLPPDDQVDLLKELPDEQYNAVLPVPANKEREDLVKLAPSYRKFHRGSVWKKYKRKRSITSIYWIMTID
ncbi:MAG: hypothetical protein WCS35_09960 [Sphaerochaeta sp.]